MISFEIKKQVVLIYLWLWWITSTNICVNATNDSLKPGDTLNSKSKLCSKQGKFCLQFSNNSIGSDFPCLFISVNVDYGTVVWMYDINHSIDFNTSVLLLDYSGVLKIESQNRKLPIIIYSSPQPTNNTMATILDTGNFVLQQLHPNGTKSILWQSFDYPTDVLIPMMKLGVNRKTGHKWSLVSDKFNLEWGPKEGELNIKKSGKVYWKSGKLKSNGLFENIPANVQNRYQYIIVSNKDEDSFTFEVKDGKFAQWELISKGRLVGDDGYIANADMCYGYSDGGCQKWEDIPTCREPGEVFQKKAGRPSIDNSTTFEEDVTYSYSDCKMRCWKNCNCSAFQEYYDNGTGCVFHSWNSKSKLCSKQGKFCLQFSNNSIGSDFPCLFISVNVDYGTVVWMYDINHSIDLNSAVLSLDYSGVLKIESQNRKPIIIYSSPQPINNTMATILDTGNFVLRQFHPNGSMSVLWQSFDYPDDTLVPTMKLGVNRKTGHNWSLVSGEFNLDWEPKQGELIIKKSGKVYWKSGKLKSNGLFENIPVNVQHMYQYIIVSNKDEDSFTFKTKDKDYKTLPWWTLLPSGRLMGNEGDIVNADMCYGYNSDGGCQKWEDIPTCRAPGEGFQKKAGRPNIDNSTTLFIGVNADSGPIVWMYDINHSIDLNSAVLSLDYSGVLKIESQNGNQ
ncbi:D-mannose-binding lectin protein [Medicago truncatula]|uniref:D-mannose-binding lectin protein n=1 Tax=Medicago truncatula TaxID=3880 RepID=G7LA16_MEDTR|nr:D-mannose-binding lectin protein [Medicago truncatula]